MSILEVNNVSKSFGGVKANVDISMSVEKGKIVGLIGQLSLQFFLFQLTSKYQHWLLRLQKIC